MQEKRKKAISHAKQFEALSKVSRTITSNLYLEDILKLIVTVTAEIMNSKICSLMLIDEKTGELILKATQSMSEAYNKKPHLRIGEGIAGKVALNGEVIGHLGELHPKIKQAWGLAQTPVMFELDLDAVCLRGVPHFVGVDKHQDVERDIAVVVKESVLHDELMACIWASEHDGILKNACLFDVYRPKEQSTQLAQDEKSLTIRLVLNKSQSTLTEPEIEALVEHVLSALAKNVGARLRA